VADRLTTADDSRAVSARGITWSCIERPTRAEAEALASAYQMDPADIVRSLDRGGESGLWQRTGYLLLQLQVPLPVVERVRSGISTAPVALLIRPDVLLTVHTGEVRSLVRLFQQCSSPDVREEIFAGGATALLTAVVRCLVETADTAVARVGQDIATLEDAATGEMAVAVVSTLVRLQRRTGEVRRAIASWPAILRRLEDLAPSPGMSGEWDRLASRAEVLTRALEDSAAICTSLLMGVTAASTLQWERRLRALIAVAALTLPVIAVAVILAMAPANPLRSLPDPFAAELALVGTVFLIALFVLRRQGIL
jgi:Mg2+ and Co2+ transporter CorA